jgi:integrase
VGSSFYGTFYSEHFKPAVRRALPESLHGLRFHDLRHTCVALMVNLAGADPYLVMKRMGHSSITVTSDRAKLFPERDAEITSGLDAAYRRATAFDSESDAEVIAFS